MMEEKYFKSLSSTKSLGIFISLLIVLEFIIYRDFIGGKYLLMFKDLGDDSYIGVYPHYVAKMQALINGEIPQWSFNTAMGENTYPFWFEPISIGILYTFFKNDVAAGMLWVQLVHTFLSGVLFYYFLKSLKIHYLPNIIGALLYAFSSYMLLYGTWVVSIFAAEVTQMAFLLLSLEQFISYRRWYLYPFAIALIAIHQPFDIYFAAIITVVYMLLKLPPQYKSQFKTWSMDIGRLVLMGSLGLALSAFMLLSNLNQMLNSPRGSGEAAYNNTLKNESFGIASVGELKTSFLRLFSTNLEGSVEYTGWYNFFEAPTLYCGLIVLLLIPQLFHFIEKQEKKIYGGILTALLFIFLVPYFRYSIWLFSGNYYRFLSLLFVIIALIFSAKTLDFICRGRKVNIITLFVTTVLTSILLLFQQVNIAATPKPFVIVFFLIVYAVLLGFNQLKQSPYFVSILLVLVCFELLIFSSPTLGERKICTYSDIYGTTGYNDATKMAINDIQKRDTSFYRIEKDYFSGISRDASYNEAKVQGFYGIRSYNSFHNMHFIHFMKSVGQIKETDEFATRWVNGLINAPFAMQLAGVKYILSNDKNAVSKYHAEDVDSLTSFNGVKILKLKHSLPLGVPYSHFIRNENFKKLSDTNKQKCLLQAIVIDDKTAAILRGMQEIIQIDTLQSLNTDLLTKDIFNIKSFKNNHISGSITVSEQPKMLFFSIPYDAGWTIKANGIPQTVHIVFSGLMGIMLDKGTYDIELAFEDPYKSIGTKISIGAFLLLLGMVFYSFYKKRSTVQPLSKNA